MTRKCYSWWEASAKWEMFTTSTPLFHSFFTNLWQA
jgi:hypothetical protein